MNSIHHFLYDWRWLILVINLAIIVWQGRTVLAALAGGSAAVVDPAQAALRRSTPGARPQPPKPSMPPRPVVPPPPAPRPALPPKPEPPKPVPAEGFQRRLSEVATEPDGARVDRAQPKPAAEAKPAETPRAEKSDDASIAELFKGLAEPAAPAAPPTPAPADKQRPMSGTEAVRRAERFEEIGFHHTIPADADAATTAPAPTPPKPAAPTAAPAAATSAPADARPAPTGATAALDDILARLDQALTEEKTLKPIVAVGEAPKPAPPEAAAKPTALEPKASDAQHAADGPSTATKKPMWARADIFDEDLPSEQAKGDQKPAVEPKQMGLFDQDDTKKKQG